MDKEVRSDAKLKNLPPEVRETLWRYRYPEEDGEKLPMVAILAALQREHGITSSLASLSEFYSWQRLQKRMETARARAEQAKLELMRTSDLSPEDIERVGQCVFTSETVEAGNVKAFVQLAKLRLASRSLELDARRLAILEAKAAQADKATEVLSQKISPEEQIKRLRAILV